MKYLNKWHKKKLNSIGVKNVKIRKSTRKNKQLVSEFKYKNKKIKVHFGDPNMPEYPGTKRGDNYCARSYGIGKNYKILKDPTSPNTWSRIILWDCKGKKSKRR